jgi:hypothetical protein
MRVIKSRGMRWAGRTEYSVVHTEVCQENLKRRVHLGTIGTLEDSTDINLNKLCCVRGMD